MEILLGNLREGEGGGGNCLSSGRNRQLVVSTTCFQCPFLANYIFLWDGGGEKESVKVYGLLDFGQYKTLQP